MVKEKKMKAFIYTGGEIDCAGITERPEEQDIVIAADSGYKNAKLMGIRPHVILGDFDSLDKDAINGEKCEIITVPAEKDFTDTQLAVSEAIKRGAAQIVIIGGLSGRLDHTLSNLAILEDMHSKGIRATITDGNNRISYLKNDSALIMRSQYKYISLIAKSDKVKGVEIDGCKYPLKNAVLTDKYQYAISNEITGNCAFVAVKKGAVLIIESKDRP